MNIATSIPDNTLLAIKQHQSVILALDITIHHFACLCEGNLLQVDFRDENMCVKHSEIHELTFKSSTPANLIRWQIQHRILEIARSFYDTSLIQSDIIMISRVRQIEIKFVSLGYALSVSL